ncbi:class I SAM-dependent methyltransferase [Porticoccaceae bacterium]|nr:class I SAM-dependent methyltransferase [Porticoccaceae bacterium]
MDISTLFEDKADLYASARPLYPVELFDYIGSLLDNHDAAWDCATGNGQAALGLAKIFTAVEATDISKEQLKNCFKAPNIKYSEQPAETTSFTDNQFDLVNVAQALHWFEYDKFWAEIKRVLKPNGVFFAHAYLWPHVNTAIDHVIQQQVKNVIEPYWAPNNRLAWNGYAELDFPFPLIETPQFVLENHWNLEEFFNYMHTWSATRRCMEDIGDHFFQQAKDAAGCLWGDPAEKRVIISPLTIIAGRAW